jgi:hypothetical protein
LQVCPTTHTTVHEPQCVTSVRVSMHAPAHTPKPCGHVQVASSHVAPIAHVRPHALQLSGSFATLTQPPAQLTVGGEHVEPHVPALQSWPCPHLFVQEPQ